MYFAASRVFLFVGIQEKTVNGNYVSVGNFFSKCLITFDWTVINFMVSINFMFVSNLSELLFKV